MTGEWLNELCVLMAYRELQHEWLELLTTEDELRGYVWMGRAVAFMDAFYADRERYPHFGDFIPRIVEFYNQTSRDIEAITKEVRNRTPRVVEVTPAAR